MSTEFCTTATSQAFSRSFLEVSGLARRLHIFVEWSSAAVKLTGYVLLPLLFLSQAVSAATITVTTTADSGPGSLREAVVQSDNGGTIIFDSALDGTPIYLDSQIVLSNIDITIIGNGTDQTIVSGNNTTRIFLVEGFGNITLRALTLIDGVHDMGGAMYVEDSVHLALINFVVEGNSAVYGDGGGICVYCAGCELHFLQGKFIHNAAAVYGGGVEVIGAKVVQFDNILFSDNISHSYGGYGGGLEVWDSDSLYMFDCAVISNSVLEYGWSVGGGISIYEETSAVIARSTFAGNTALAHGGGIYHYANNVDLSASTIVNNIAESGAGYFFDKYLEPSHARLRSNLIANNIAHDSSDVAGDTIFSLGYNLVGRDEDKVLQRLGSDLLGFDPLLLPVADNGGNTPTLALMPSSPAIDAGDPADMSPDQLGRPVINGRRDIGAYEYGPTYFYADLDGDGWGDPNDYREGLPAPAGYVLNNLDNCPDTYNPDQLDLNENGIGDACEPTTAPMEVFYLATECANVGSAFQLDVNSAGDGEVYAEYLGNPETNNPPADLPDNRIRFTVPNAVAGDYAIFARIDAPDVASDSYWVRVNDGEWLKWYRQLITTGFEWKQVMNQTFPLKAGLNKIDFAYREPNTKLEKIRVSMDLTPPTDGSGGSDYACATEIEYTDEFWLATSCATIGDNFTVAADPEITGLTYAMYAGSASMTNPPADLPENRVRYRVNNALAGAYYLYAYVLTPDGNSDSFWVRINDGEWIKWSQNLATAVWRWKAVAGAPFSLVEGENTIDFAYREPNARIAGIHFDPEKELPLDSQRPPADGCGTNPGGGGTLDFWREAECAQVGSRFELRADAGASNGSYAVYTGASTTGSVPADIPDNYIRFTLEGATANRHRLFARVYCASGTEDSFYVRVNNGEWTPWLLGLTDGQFGWKEFGTLPLLQNGENTIDFAYRENNARLDKIYVTQYGTMPSSPGESDSRCN